jgi:competence protein ComEA
MHRTKRVGTFAVLAVLLAAPLAHAQGDTSTPATPAPGTPEVTSTPATTPSPASTTAPATETGAAKHAAAKHKVATAPKHKVAAAPRLDLNAASREDLMKLPGIGEAIADKIIAARPFKTKSELVSKKIMTRKAYAAISSRVVAKQPPMANSSGK